jgi:hypothetical protein
MADLIGVVTAAFQGIAAAGTVAAAAGSLKAASQARDSVVLAEMTRHIERLAAIADTVESLIEEDAGDDGHVQRELIHELAHVDDALPLCRRCAAASGGHVVGQGPALRREVGAALRAARLARREYAGRHASGNSHGMGSVDAPAPPSGEERGDPDVWLADPPRA